jgi:hypothetical protein
MGDVDFDESRYVPQPSNEADVGSGGISKSFLMLLENSEDDQ